MQFTINKFQALFGAGTKLSSAPDKSLNPGQCSQIPPGIPIKDPPEFTNDASFDNFSPRIVLDYALTNTILTYASFSRGFKRSGFNSFGLAPAFDDEEVEAFEISLKTTALEQRLRIDAAYFN